MTSKIPLIPPQGSCCPGPAGKDSACCGNSASPSDAADPAGPRRSKPVLSGLVLAAALIIGAFSLRASQTSDSADASACCPAPVTIAPVGQLEYGIGGSTVTDSTLDPATAPEDSSRGN